MKKFSFLTILSKKTGQKNGPKKLAEKKVL